MVKRIIGAMSGTSCDGLDIASCLFEGNGRNTVLKVEAVENVAYSPEQREWLYQLTSGKISVSDVACANFYLGRLFGTIINDFIKKNSLEGVIDLIVSHGQTVFHKPMSGDSPYEPACTLQIGDGDIIARYAGYPVLSDVRIKDMAYGGQGAPMVVWADYVLFSVPGKNVAMQNIGGIGNVTFLPADGSLDHIQAFDTGPGNVLIDAACRKYFSYPFDEDGKYSKTGNVHPDLLHKLQVIETEYVDIKPPKSTGKEIRYHKAYQEKIAEAVSETQCSSQDCIRTLVELTVWTIEENYHRYLNPVDKIVVTGGGAFNPVLIKSLKHTFPDTEIHVPESEWTKFKEAIAFAVIGNEYLNQHFANVPSATGSIKAVKLGKLCLPD
jgi:anhydro-N-acetylmuramic acid kinase